MDKQASQIIEYAKYIEDHRANVMKAWKILQKPCKDMNFVYDDFLYETITGNIKNHDLSKYSQFEFIQYQERFFPTRHSIDGEELANAWEHHKQNNRHHWENVVVNGQIEDVVEMVCDWMAMSFHFGDTAEDYYLKNESKIKLQDWQIKTIKEIFEAIRRD